MESTTPEVRVEVAIPIAPEPRGVVELVEIVRMEKVLVALVDVAKVSALKVFPRRVVVACTA